MEEKKSGGKVHATCVRHDSSIEELQKIAISTDLKMEVTKKINYSHFYRTWHGHEIPFLRSILDHFREAYPKKNFIYLAGDSSLDNKAWLEETTGAVNGYQDILEPKLMKKDVAYHLNKVLATYGKDYVCINTSIEETTLAVRGGGKSLLPQDEFIR